MNFKKLHKAFKSPNLVLRKLIRLNSKLITNDRLYLSAIYRLSLGKRIHWDAPSTFNEKMQWLKLWSKDKGFERYVDKYEVRKYIAEKIGDEYLIPAYGVWERFEDIEFDSLPADYVLKTTHDSGGIVIVRNNTIPPTAKKFLNNRLKNNYFYREREYPYRNVKPRIIAEKYMTDESGTELKDYKFFCFNGKPEVLFIASNRFNAKGEKARFDYFNMDLKKLPFTSLGHLNAFTDGSQHSPIANFEKMKELAAILSEGFPFIRIDFYNINGKIYFGEMTFFQDAGIVPFSPEEWDLKLGNMIKLPIK